MHQLRQKPIVVAAPFPGAVANLRPVEQRFRDMTQFGQRQYDSRDYDPFHPLLHHLQKGMSREHQLWSSVLFMAFYNPGSSHIAFMNSDPLKMPPDWCFQLPVGVQRRNLRGGKIRDHLEDFIKQAKYMGSLYDFLTYGMNGMFKKSGRQNWTPLKRNVGSVWGNGRWSVYTSSELFQKVNGLPALPNEIGNDGSTGPRTGLCYLYGVEPPTGKKVVPLLDELADQLFKMVDAKVHTNLPYLPLNHYDHGMLESLLCDFNSLRKGRYYVGRDIDRDQERINGAKKTLTLLMLSRAQHKHLDAVWQARAECFERRYLGEYSGWEGRTKEALTHYFKTGEVMDHAEIIEANKDGKLF